MCAVIAVSIFIGFKLGNNHIVEKESSSEIFSANTEAKESETTTTRNETTTTESTTVQETTEKATQKTYTTSVQTTATQQNLDSDDFIVYYDGENFQLIEKSPEYKEHEAKYENTTAFVITEDNLVYETRYSIESNNDVEIDGFENSFSDEIDELLNNMN